MASIGDWRWANNVTDVQVFNEEQELVRTVNLFIEDLKVGDAAQTTFALGANYEVLEDVNLRLDYNYYDNYFADFDPNNRSTADQGQAWEAPAYGLLDFGLTYGFDIGSLRAILMVTLITYSIQNISLMLVTEVTQQLRKLLYGMVSEELIL